LIIKTARLYSRSSTFSKESLGRVRDKSIFGILEITRSRLALFKSYRKTDYFKSLIFALLLTMLWIFKSVPRSQTLAIARLSVCDCSYFGGVVAFFLQSVIRLIAHSIFPFYFITCTPQTCLPTLKSSTRVLHQMGASMRWSLGKDLNAYYRKSYIQSYLVSVSMSC
jgi:hypothetical protein